MGVVLLIALASLGKPTAGLGTLQASELIWSTDAPQLAISARASAENDAMRENLGIGCRVKGSVEIRGVSQSHVFRGDPHVSKYFGHKATNPQTKPRQAQTSRRKESPKRANNNRERQVRGGQLRRHQYLLRSTQLSTGSVPRPSLTPLCSVSFLDTIRHRAGEVKRRTCKPCATVESYILFGLELFPDGACLRYYLSIRGFFGHYLSLRPDLAATLR